MIRGVDPDTTQNHSFTHDPLKIVNRKPASLLRKSPRVNALDRHGLRDRGL
jgi:hypothetical protein